MEEVVSGLRIIPAIGEEAASLTAVAFASVRYWDYPEDWILSWSEALTITPEFLADNEVWKCVSDEEILAFYALVTSGDSAELSHLWVLPQRIGTGVGRILFHDAKSRASRLGAVALYIESEPRAEDFYLKMGAVRIGETVFDQSGAPRILPRMSVDLR